MAEVHRAERARGFRALALVCGFVVAGGCRIEPDWTTPTGGGGGAGTAVEVDGNGAREAAAGARAAGSGMGASSANAGSVVAGAGEGGERARAEDAGAAGVGGSTPAENVCAAQRVELGEFARGEVRAGARVELAAVATSQKFLLSHAQSGSCLWGMFAGAEPEGGEPRGVLVVSFGEEAAGDTACRPGTDGIPDALRPSDRVRLVGRYSEFLPESCAGGVAEPQVLVDPACPVLREEGARAVEPVTISPAIADELARGADPELVRRYAGGLVRLEGLSGLRADAGQGVVGPYGVIRFAETRLEAHNDIAYGDLGAGGPGAPEKSLVFPHPTEFARMLGLIHLDYCTWSLALRDPCADIEPPSENCRD